MFTFSSLDVVAVVCVNFKCETISERKVVSFPIVFKCDQFFLGNVDISRIELENCGFLQD